MKPFVYIASPYTKGDVGMNVRFQCQVFNQLLNSGIVLPYAPLWSHFQHTVFPRPYEQWIAYDLDIIPRFDACLRLDATCPGCDYVQIESTGADREVKEFHRLNKPVFYRVTGLYDWARGFGVVGG